MKFNAEKIYRHSFASDNNSGVHPYIMQALFGANSGHVIAYGDDPFTLEAKNIFAGHFGDDVRVYFVMSGTGANTSALYSITRPYNSIICAETAHINVDECNAPGKFSGCRITDIPTEDGKLNVEMIKACIKGRGDVHNSQPGVISITQPTELGTLYSADEIRQICDFAHDNKMLVHMDGARISNAAFALDMPFKEFTRDAGIDVLSFGGTKNGMMFGEAVVFFRDDIATDFEYFQKQSTQLISKMRYISVQFSAFLKNDLWKINAGNANKMAELLADKVSKIEGISIAYPRHTNAVFVYLPKEIISKVIDDFPFYIADDENGIVRWMCSFDTTEEDIRDLLSCIRSQMNK
ncbi:MAG: low specificity L-threonine aldolase [Methanomicrobiaceae archaeon]|nr:low specificity L-threonine aldolase [Methanomicrobiaceae archaeon]